MDFDSASDVNEASRFRVLRCTFDPCVFLLFILRYCDAVKSICTNLGTDFVQAESRLRRETMRTKDVYIQYTIDVNSIRPVLHKILQSRGLFLRECA